MAFRATAGGGYGGRVPDGRAVTAFIAEDATCGDDGRFWTGTFFGHVEAGCPVEAFEGLSLSEALAWARARADEIRLRIGDGPEVMVDGAFAGPATVWRRADGEHWRDRGRADPPIEWEVTLLAFPPADQLLEPEATDGPARELAGRLGASGPDTRSFEAFRAELRRAQRRRNGREVGLASYELPAYRMRVRARAATHRQAEADVVARAGAVAGWRIEAQARPAEP